MSLSHTIRKVFTENSDSTLNHKQVCSFINVREGAIRKLVYSVLEDLAKSGFLKKNGYSAYTLNNNEHLYEGYIQLTARKAGFVIIDDPDINDIFVAPQDLGQAIGGDLVKVRVTKKGRKRLEGEVVEVVNRERSQFVGTIQLHEKYAFLVPDNPRVGINLFIPKEKLNGAKDNDKAIGKITIWPKTAQNPYGEILEVLGNNGGNDTEMISILINQGLDYKFPPE
ncbi:MAG: hypothetical protein KC454_10800, partial [Flavobacteriales bacterium]|nr:hypothetical protein [Flavobacteriales bacterium]